MLFLQHSDSSSFIAKTENLYSRVILVLLRRVNPPPNTSLSINFIYEHVLDYDVIYLINHCQVRRLTITETQIQLQQSGIDISVATVKNYKSQIRAQAGQWIAKLAKSKRNDYIAEYRERVMEIMRVQRFLWSVIEGQPAGPRTKVEAANSLMKATDALIQLYDCMPLINAIRDYDARQSNSRYQEDLKGSNNNQPGGIDYRG